MIPAAYDASRPASPPQCCRARRFSRISGETPLVPGFGLRSVIESCSTAGWRNGISPEASVARLESPQHGSKMEVDGVDPPTLFGANIDQVLTLENFVGRVAASVRDPQQPLACRRVTVHFNDRVRELCMAKSISPMDSSSIRTTLPRPTVLSALDVHRTASVKTDRACRYRPSSISCLVDISRVSGGQLLDRVDVLRAFESSSPIRSCLASSLLKPSMAWCAYSPIAVPMMERWICDVPELTVLCLASRQ